MGYGVLEHKESMLIMNSHVGITNHSINWMTAPHSKPEGYLYFQRPGVEPFRPLLTATANHGAASDATKANTKCVCFIASMHNRFLIGNIAVSASRLRFHHRYLCQTFICYKGNHQQ